MSLRQLPGVGSVLVNHTGEALYSNDLEANGMIVCVTACNAFWNSTSSSGAGYGY